MIDIQNESENPEGFCTICHKDLKDASSLCFDCNDRINYHPLFDGGYCTNCNNPLEYKLCPFCS